MCGRVFVIAVIASLAVPSVAEEIAEVDASAQFGLIRKRVVEDASDVTAASAVNAGAEEIAEVGASAQFALIRKRVVEDASDVTAASAVNADAVETGKGALVVEAGKELQEGEAKEEPGPDAEADKEPQHHKEEDIAGDDEAWDELSQQQKRDWTLLGWSASSWNAKSRPGPAGERLWADLNAFQKAAVERLGYDKKTWDDIREADKEPQHHKEEDIAGDDEAWDELSQQQKKDWTLLGWSASSWNAKSRPGPVAEKLWATLTPAQQTAVERLGYDQKTWDDIRKPGMRRPGM